MRNPDASGEKLPPAPETGTPNFQTMTTMKLIRAIRDRWSPRAYTPRSVTTEQLQLLFEAARWAPSANNSQAWSYYYTTRETPDAHAQLAACLTGGNRAWAPDASVLIVSVGNKFFPGTETLNRHWMHDVGAANVSIALQAAEMGLQLHQMAGFDLDACSQLLGLDPDKEEPVTMMTLGYPGPAELLPEPFRSREMLPRTRKETTAFVHRLP